MNSITAFSWTALKIFWVLVVAVTAVSPEAQPNPEQYLRPSLVSGPARWNCAGSGDRREPRSRVNTATRVARLRNEMTRSTVHRGSSLDAYIVTSFDEHQNQFVSEHHRRLQYISGFSGPAGVAVVTHDRAALWPRVDISAIATGSIVGPAEPGPGWTEAGLGIGPADDDPYDDQADRQLDCSWTLVRRSRFAPTPSNWLSKELPEYARVGADARTIPATLWQKWLDTLATKYIELVPLETNLVDLIWTDRPKQKHYDVGVHNLLFAGVSWQDKVVQVRREMQKTEADILLVSQLDEVAWLLNVRTSDILGVVPFAPLFPAYVILTQEEIRLYTNTTRLKESVHAQLQTRSCYHRLCVKVFPYQSVKRDIADFGRSRKMWLSPHPLRGVSWAIVDSIPDEKKIMSSSPIHALKAIKNSIERQQMRNAHVKDAASICDVLLYLEEDISVAPWDETKLASQLDRLRWREMFRGPAYPTVAAYAAHGAHPLVIPEENTSATIGGDSTIVIDVGGQYVNGTTEVGRTIHLGHPEIRHIEAYTRVLQCLIEVARAVVPVGTTADRLDTVARGPLWAHGRDYRHPLGHGVGSFLWAYEEPVFSLNNTKVQFPLQDGYFFTAGPSYTVHGEFGIRLKNVLEVLPLNSKTSSPPYYLQFRSATLVPFEHKLINVTMLSPEQREWLNQYNARIRSEVGAELKRRNSDMKVFHWMMRKTGYVGVGCPPYVPPSVEAAIIATADASSAGSTSQTMHLLLLVLCQILLLRVESQPQI